MADVSIYGLIQSQTELRQGCWGIYWADASNGVAIAMDNGADLQSLYTDDGGATWSATEVVAGNVKRLTCFYDKELPTDTGTTVHVAWLDVDAGAGYYVAVDAADGTVGTVRTFDGALTVVATDTLNRLTICKNRAGNLVIVGSTQVDEFAYKSSDQFATSPTSIAEPIEAANQEDWVMLHAANTGDGNDVALFFHDRSSNAISVKMYDDSANTWTETAIAGGVADTIQYRGFDCVMRHSDGKIIIVAHNNPAASSNDLVAYEINPNSIASPGVTSLTNVFTNAANILVGLMINQQNGYLYAGVAVSGTWLTTMSVQYYLSTDGGSTWGSAQTYSDTDRDYRGLSGGRSVGDAGGNIMFVMYDEDNTELYTNTANAVAISAAVAGGPRRGRMVIM